MYCPNCGSNNQSEVKFCTRCGTNLGVVSDALGAKGSGSTGQIDERQGKLIKDYYKGRRDAITGMVLIPAGVKTMLLLNLFGLPPIASFFIVSWLFFWGIAALAGGLGKWMASSGEMRALGYEVPKSELRERVLRLLGRQSTVNSLGTPTVADYSTGPVSSPISTPASVTEETTRTLEEKVRLPKQIQ
jgi:hypothetical protein